MNDDPWRPPVRAAFPCASLAEALPHLRRPPVPEAVHFKIQNTAGDREEIWTWPASPMWGDGDEPGVPVERPIFFFELVGDTVWGATASMLRQLLGLALGVPTGIDHV